jgi:hypothetical protein
LIVYLLIAQGLDSAALIAAIRACRSTSSARSLASS